MLLTIQFSRLYFKLNLVKPKTKQMTTSYDPESQPILDDLISKDPKSAGEANYERLMSHNSYQGAANMVALKVQPTVTFVSSSITLIVLVLTIPLALFVLVPAYVNFLTWQNDIVIDSIAIINPNNEGFTSSVTQRFSANCPVTAKVAMHNDVVLSWNHEGGGKLATLTHSNAIDVTTTPGQLNSYAQIYNLSAFTNFNSYAVSSSSMEWRIEGSATVHTVVDVDVTIEKSVSLHGFSGFKEPPIIESVNVTGGTAAEMITSLLATLKSTSNIEIHFGQDLLFSLKSNGVKVGRGVIPNAKMLTGSYLVNSNTYLAWSSDTEKNELMAVLSSYANGNDVPVTLDDFHTETPIQWLQPALQTIQMTGTFPAMTAKFLVSSVLYAPRNPLKGVDFTLDIYNPQQCDITITGMSGLIYYEGKEIGIVEQPTGLNIVIPPGATVTSSVLHAAPHPAGVQEYADLVQAGFGYVDVTSTTYLNIGEFPTILAYNQQAIATTVVKL